MSDKLNHAPTGPFVLLLDGDPLVGKTLTARPNAVRDKDGIDAKTQAFQWTLDGVAIPGATEQRYTLQASDRGHWIGCEWSYTDLGGTRETVVSKALDTYVMDSRMQDLAGLYRIFFERDPDPVGLVFWADALPGLFAAHRSRFQAMCVLFSEFEGGASPEDLERLRAIEARDR